MARLYFRITVQKDRPRNKCIEEVAVKNSTQNVVKNKKGVPNRKQLDHAQHSFKQNEEVVESILSPQSSVPLLENRDLFLAPKYAFSKSSSRIEGKNSCRLCSDEDRNCCCAEATLSTCSSSISGFSLSDNVANDVRTDCRSDQVENMKSPCMNGRFAIMGNFDADKTATENIASTHQEETEKTTIFPIISDVLDEAIQNLDLNTSISCSKGMYDEAIYNYEKSLILKRKTIRHILKSNFTANLHVPPMIRGKISEMIDFESFMMPNDASFNRLDENTKNALVSVAVSLNNITYLKYKKGYLTPQDTLAAYLQSLQIKCEILGRNHASVGKTLNNIGSVFYLQRDYQSALVAYKEALRILESAKASDQLEASATVLSNIGDVYSCFCAHSSALEHYRKALNIRWRSLGPCNMKVIRLMEQIATLEMKLANQGLTQPFDSDESDSDGEEFVREDLENRVKYLQEVNFLKSSVQADLEFFDWMEQQATIDFLHDEAVLSRGMEDLTKDISQSPKLTVPAPYINQLCHFPNNETTSCECNVQSDDAKAFCVHKSLEKCTDEMSDTASDIVPNLPMHIENMQHDPSFLSEDINRFISNTLQPVEFPIRDTARHICNDGSRPESERYEKERAKTQDMPWYDVTDFTKMNPHQRTAALFVVRERLQAVRASNCQLSESSNSRPKNIEPTVFSFVESPRIIVSDRIEQNCKEAPKCRLQIGRHSQDQRKANDPKQSTMDKRKMVLELYKKRKMAGKS